MFWGFWSYLFFNNKKRRRTSAGQGGVGTVVNLSGQSGPSRGVHGDLRERCFRFGISQGRPFHIPGMAPGVSAVWDGEPSATSVIPGSA